MLRKERVVVIIWIFLGISFKYSEAVDEVQERKNLTCDFGLIEESCNLNLLEMDVYELYNESLSTAICLFGIQGENVTDVEDMEVGENNTNKNNTKETLRCMMEDTRRILKCGGSVILPDENIMNLFFDGLLDAELRETDVYDHDCVFCFMAQFHKILRTNLLASNLDVLTCDVLGTMELNISMWDEVARMIYVFLTELDYVKMMTDSPDYSVTRSTPWIERFLDANTWAVYEFNVRTYTVSLLDNSEISSEVRTLLFVLHGILFLVGITGNMILFLIFARHRDMLTSHNKIILNLSIGDTFSLVSNFTVLYSSLLDTVGNLRCLLITLFVPLSTGICVYSVTMLSLQRYVAVVSAGKVQGGREFLRKYSTAILISLVWILALASALSQFLKTSFFEGYCAIQLAPPNVLINVIIYCAIPVVVMAAFTLMTSLKMKRSVRNMPGEVTGQRAARTARNRSANILIAFIIVFAVSYVPYYLFLVAYAYLGLEEIGFDQMFIISYSLIFVNSCFNPIALYSASASFRKHFNKYLFCCFHFNLKFWRGEEISDTLSQSTKKSSITSTNL